MNRTLQATLGVILILVITFSAISVTQQMGRQLKLDVTDQKIFTLSNGTKAILARLNQPIKARLYYGKTAAMQGSDQIRIFNNYYEFVRALLEEYVQVSQGMVELEIIDPRPYTKEEEDALKNGLRRVPLTQEENFFFGLVVQTEFGITKAIPFFSPDRQNFIEYDISYLIDTAITRDKQTVGIMSSLSVMGDSGYMAQLMRYQQQQPKPAWGIVDQLKSQFEVKEIAADINDVNEIENVDVLLVVHPKDLPEKTQFAIDQFVLQGGRTIVCIDPHCWIDRPEQPNQQQMMMQQTSQGSNLEALLQAWGLEMPDNTFAGDRRLAMEASITRNQRAQKIIGYLGLTPPESFNRETNVSAQLNDVKMLFAGVLRDYPGVDPNTLSGLKRTPLVQTTSAGNSFRISAPYELQFLNPPDLMNKFTDGAAPVTMGYLLTGTFPSAFPNGIEEEVEEQDPNDPNSTITITRQITGLTTSAEEGAVILFSDVDFMTDMMAFSNSFLGRMTIGDNSALLVNAVEDLGGSSDLISIRSRGNYRRPFLVVDQIEAEAEKETEAEVARLQAEIDGYNQNLQSLVSSANEGEQGIVGSDILQKRRDIELKIRQAERQLNEVKLKRRERIESLGARLRQINMLVAPSIILIIAIALGLHRSMRKRNYIGSQA
jgi:ABC-type uncharacterized transport system involved in gliding motility auxiliary subunit